MKTFKKLICFAGIIVLLGIYILTAVFAITDQTAMKSWLSASLFSTFAVPLFLYAFLLVLKTLEQKKSSEDENESK